MQRHRRSRRMRSRRSFAKRFLPSLAATMMRALTDIARRCGGSLAQCDLIHLTFTEAALRASRARLAQELVAERAAQKPASLFNRLLQRRLGLLVPAMA